MGGRRRSSVNEGLEAFSRAYGLTKGVMSDMDDAEVKGLMKEKMDASRAEADASGGLAYTLDAGKDNKSAPDFVYGDKVARNSAAEVIAFEKEMASQPYSPEEGKAASGLGAVASPIATAVPGQTMSRAPQEVTGLSAITSPKNMSVEPPPATEVAAPKEEYTTGEISTPKLSAADIFHKRYAPSVTAKMIEQGKYKEATAFDEWSRSAKGAAYGDAWSKAMMMPEGDAHGRVNAVVDIYNKQLPDGQYAIAKQGEDGQYTVQVRNEKTHALVGSHTATADDVFKIGAGMLAPKEAFTIQMNAKLTAEKEAAAERMQDKKEAYGLSLQDKKDASAEKRLAASNAAMLEGVDRRVQGGLDVAEVRVKGGNNGAHVQKTFETDQGIVAMMSDGSQKALFGGDGKPLRGVSGQKTAAVLVGKTLSPYGDNGDVAGKVRDMTDKLNTPKKPAETGQEYQSFKAAWDKNKGNPEAQARLEKQARSMGLLK